MNHLTTISPGLDANSFVARCACGWAHGNTFAACAARADIHKRLFADEPRHWRDPKRQAIMPVYNERTY